MEPTISTLIGIVITVGGIVFFLLGLRLNMVNELSKRLRDYVEEPQGFTDKPLPLAISTRRAELSGTFSSRVMGPWIVKVTDLIGRFTPGKISVELENQLALAGNPMGLTGRGFYVLRMGSTLIGILLAFLMLRASFLPAESAGGRLPIPVTGAGSESISSSSNNLYLLAASALALIIFTYLPKSWLRRKVRRKKNEISKTLPDALDMLSVCANAGLGFDQSLQRLSEYWDTALSDEFGRVVAEMGMGIPRREALRNLANRIDVPELSSFVAVIVQSDQLGMSITQTLQTQAKQMRIERRFKAQEQARKMPLKMLFPLMLFIFPSMFAVILGPMVPILGEVFGTIRNTN